MTPATRAEWAIWHLQHAAHAGGYQYPLPMLRTLQAALDAGLTVDDIHAAVCGAHTQKEAA